MTLDLNLLGIEAVNPGACTGSEWLDTKGDETASYSPIDGSLIAKITNATLEDYEHVVAKAQEAYLKWRIIPAETRSCSSSDR